MSRIVNNDSIVYSYSLSEPRAEMQQYPRIVCIPTLLNPLHGRQTSSGCFEVMNTGCQQHLPTLSRL